MVLSDVVTQRTTTVLLQGSTRQAAGETGNNAHPATLPATLSAAFRHEIYMKMNFYFYMTVILLKW